MPSRRRFLALGAVTAITGCTTIADDPPEPGSNQSTDPDRHIYGADGEWSSFGCNASNTRAVADGKAPVDGVSERWRVEVPQTTYQEPLVTDSRVFVPTPSALVVYDATDGAELWRKTRESGVDTYATPLVRGKTVYVTCMDGRTYGMTMENPPKLNIDWKRRTGWAGGGLAVKKHLYAAGTRGLHAINPDNGERVWKHDIGDWRWTAPALGRDTLFVGGDKLYAFDPTPSFRIPGTGPSLRFETSFHGRVGPGPVLNDGVLYVVAQTGERKYHLLALE